MLLQYSLALKNQDKHVKYCAIVLEASQNCSREANELGNAAPPRKHPGFADDADVTINQACKQIFSLNAVCAISNAYNSHT